MMTTSLMNTGLGLLAQTNYDGGDGAAAGGILAGGACFVIVVLIVLASLALQIWMIIDAATNASLDSTMKLIWILVILFVPFGFLIYFFVARNK